MVFEKGNVPHNKGKIKESYELLERQSKSFTGKNNSNYGKHLLSKARMGHIVTKVTREKNNIRIKYNGVKK